MSCVNHPGVAATVRCAGCLRSFCRPCVTRDAEFYYCPACGGSRAPASLNTPTAPTGVSPLGLEAPVPDAAGSVETASLVPRAIAAAVDFILVWIVLAFLLSLALEPAAVLLVVFGVPTVYEALFVMRSGQTVGKAMLGIQVVSLDGAPVGDGQAWARAFFKVVQFACCGLPLLFVPLTGDRRGVHDRIAGTRVAPAGQAIRGS